MKIPFLFFGPVAAIWSVDEVASYFIFLEGFSEALSGLLVLLRRHSADLFSIGRHCCCRFCQFGVTQIDGIWIVSIQEAFLIDDCDGGS